MKANFPAYKSHKIVHGLKVQSIETSAEDGARALITFVNGEQYLATAKQTEKAELYAKNTPNEDGTTELGYITAYDRGQYVSWSPTAQFEAGYDLTDESDGLHLSEGEEKDGSTEEFPRQDGSYGYPEDPAPAGEGDAAPAIPVVGDYVRTNECGEDGEPLDATPFSEFQILESDHISINAVNKGVYIEREGKDYLLYAILEEPVADTESGKDKEGEPEAPAGEEGKTATPAGEATPEAGETPPDQQGGAKE